MNHFSNIFNEILTKPQSLPFTDNVCLDIFEDRDYNTNSNVSKSHQYLIPALESTPGEFLEEEINDVFSDVVEHAIPFEKQKSIAKLTLFPFTGLKTAYDHFQHSLGYERNSTDTPDKSPKDENNLALKRLLPKPKGPSGDLKDQLPKSTSPPILKHPPSKVSSLPQELIRFPSFGARSVDNGDKDLPGTNIKILRSNKIEDDIGSPTNTSSFMRSISRKQNEQKTLACHQENSETNETCPEEEQPKRKYKQENRKTSTEDINEKSTEIEDNRALKWLSPNPQSPSQNLTGRLPKSTSAPILSHKESVITSPPQELIRFPSFALRSIDNEEAELKTVASRLETSAANESSPLRARMIVEQDITIEEVQPKGKYGHEAKKGEQSTERLETEQRITKSQNQPLEQIDEGLELFKHRKRKPLTEEAGGKESMRPFLFKFQDLFSQNTNIQRNDNNDENNSFVESR